MTDNQQCPMQAAHEQRLDDMQKTMERVEGRVFNGIAKDIRAELGEEISAVEERWQATLKDVREEVRGTRTLLIGTLVTIVLGLAATFAFGRVEANALAQTVTRVETQLADHLLQPGNP